MEYVIGIDSGGTNFRVMASDLQGNILGSYTGTPASHYHVGKNELLCRVEHHIDECLAQFGGIRAECRCMVCGTTGVDSESDAELLNRLYNSLQGFDCPVKVMNDAELAHYTVTGGQGVLIISGTGSIAFGRDRNGHTARAGGWMFTILGDEGSGTWVSKRALRQLARWFDGAAEDGIMLRSIRKELGIHSRADLNEIAVAAGRPPWQVPQLGKLVNLAADEGDAAAMRILREAAVEIMGIVDDVVCALNLAEKEPDFTIGVWGSNIVKSPLLFKEFRRLAGQRYPRAQVVLPQRSAVEGAVDIARNILAK